MAKIFVQTITFCFLYNLLESYMSGTIYADYYSEMKGIPAQLQHLKLNQVKPNRLQRLYFKREVRGGI